LALPRVAAAIVGGVAVGFFGVRLGPLSFLVNDVRISYRLVVEVHTAWAASVGIPTGRHAETFAGYGLFGFWLTVFLIRRTSHRYGRHFIGPTGPSFEGAILVRIADYLEGLADVLTGFDSLAIHIVVSFVVSFVISFAGLGRHSVFVARILIFVIRSFLVGRGVRNGGHGYIRGWVCAIGTVGGTGLVHFWNALEALTAVGRHLAGCSPLGSTLPHHRRLTGWHLFFWWTVFTGAIGYSHSQVVAADGLSHTHKLTGAIGVCVARRWLTPVDLDVYGIAILAGRTRRGHASHDFACEARRAICVRFASTLPSSIRAFIGAFTRLWTVRLNAIRIIRIAGNGRAIGHFTKLSVGTVCGWVAFEGPSMSSQTKGAHHTGYEHY
jgi:hypothetical protein